MGEASSEFLMSFLLFIPFSVKSMPGRDRLVVEPMTARRRFVVCNPLPEDRLLNTAAVQQQVDLAQTPEAQSLSPAVFQQSRP
jgi:hypothetical protein